VTTTIVNTHEAKSRLSELIRRVEEGEEVIVARAGKHVARIVAIKEGPKRRVPGALKGQIVVHADAFDADRDTEALFDGAEDSAPW